MGEQQIHFAIVGSLSSKPGEAGIIARNNDFHSNKSLSELYISINREVEGVQSLYRNFNSPDDNVIQYYYLNQNNSGDKLFIRAISGYTRFDSLNRRYDRREYFSIPFCETFSFEQTKEKLPEPKQYPANENNLDALTITFKISNRVQKGNIATILKSIEEKSTIAYYSADEEILLKTIDSLPLVFKKYLQIGLNILSNDNFAQNKLHFYTCIGTNNKAKHFQTEIINDKVIDFMTDLISSGNYLCIEEIQTERDFDFADKNQLYDLFQIHYQESIVELILNEAHSNIPDEKIKEIKHTFSLEIKLGVKKEKINRYYRALLKINAIDEHISESFWKYAFSLDDYGPFYNEELIPFFEKFLLTVIHRSNSFNVFYSSIILLFPQSKSQLKSIREKTILTFLDRKPEVVIDDLEDLIQYFISNNEDQIEKVLAKFNFSKNANQLTDNQFRLLLTRPVIDHLQPSIIYDLVSNKGITGLIRLFPEYNTKKINSAFVESIVKIFSADSNSFIKSLDSNTDWIFSLIDPSQKRIIGKRLLKDIESKIQTCKNDFELQDYIQTLIQNKREFIDLRERNQLLQTIFEDRVEYYWDYNGTVQAILKAARTLKFQLSAVYPKTNDRKLLSHLTSIYNEYTDVIKNKREFQNIKEEIKKVDESCTSEEVKNDLAKFNRLDSVGVLQHFNLLLENHRNNNELWERFLEGEQVDKFIQAITEGDFNPSVFKAFKTLKIKVRNTDFEYTIPLRNLFGKIDEILFERHFLKQGIIKYEIMKATKLISSVSQWIIASLVSLVLVAGIAIAFLLGKGTPLNEKINEQQIRIAAMSKENDDLEAKIKVLEKTINELPKASPLSPTPNSELNKNDLAIVNNKNIKGKSISDIVTFIFSKNPTDIGSNYTNQKEVYIEALKNANPNCFENGICTCDELISIPSYKR